MADELITLSTFRFAAKAELARLALEQEGISAFVADDNVVNMDWFLGNAVGYVKLQVPRSQAEAAMLILQKHPRLLDAKHPQQDEADDMSTCLACGEPMKDDTDRCEACGWSYDPQAAEDDA
ncbi:MAG TPA: hypothetical protein VHY20_10135 [Pirellulales bacterium]|jgi:hypothetical protein|nr:hypothetical protein [Pirellulales bacterium]